MDSTKPEADFVGSCVVMAVMVFVLSVILGLIFLLIPSYGPLVFLFAVEALCLAGVVQLSRGSGVTVRQRLTGGVLAMLICGSYPCFFVQLAVRQVYSAYKDVPLMQQFASQDFSRFSTGPGAIVTGSDIDAFLEKQVKLMAEIKTLEDAKATLQLMSSQNNDVSSTISNLDRLEGVLDKELLPQADRQRILKVRQSLSFWAPRRTEVKLPRSMVEDYGFSKNDLLHYKQILDDQNWLWYVLLRGAGLID